MHLFSSDPRTARARTRPAWPVLLGALSLLPLAPSPTLGQEVPIPPTLQGGVPEGEATPGELPLSLPDAIARGLRSNLAAVVGREDVRAAEGARTSTLADLLPQVRGAVAETRQKINLAAFGFTGPGIPELVGPFNVFDIRAYLQQTILDLHALHKAHAASDALDAARQDELSTRDLVVLACGQLYLQAVAAESRIAAARAQLDTAEALLGLARDRKAAGLGAGLEAVRAQVQAEAQHERLIVAEQQAARQKLALARAIGLPPGQRIRLTDPMPFAPLAAMSREEALERALRDRPDLKAAQSRLEAAQEAVEAARGERLPTVGVTADYGAIGNDVPGALGTFSVGVGVRVPVFEGRRLAGRITEAEARERQARARYEDARARISYEIDLAFLDLRAAEERVGVADATLALAREQLVQSRDRFAAGVTDNIEVVQAQDALAAAEESHIASLFAHNAAKLSLARALGGAEAGYAAFLEGRN
jgi:outer membrane protein TolC